MATIVLRSTKGSPLTIAEADANFNNLNTEVGTKLTASEFTAVNILGLLSEYDADGDGQGLNAATILAKELDSAATVDTIALRDIEGGLTATQFNGPLVGNVTGNLTGNVTGNVSGTALNVTGTVLISNGGTGATTATTARSNLGLGSIATQASSSVTITGGTITGITDLAIADGGTGASSAAQARGNLGLVIGSDVQPFSNELTGIAGATSGTGFYVRTGTASVVQRSIAVGGNGLSITNADGVSANPTISIATSASMTLAGLSLNSLTVSGSSSFAGASFSGVSVTSISTPFITKSGSNGVGDIGQSDNRYNVIYGRATSAQYADLAEKYTTDQEYEPGTVIVVALAGESETTSSFQYGQRVLGVVSTNPAHVMNDGSEGQAIGLVGRLPVKVIGPIKKGQPIVASPDGKAIAGEDGYIFGQALETNLEHGVKLVECFIK